MPGARDDARLVEEQRAESGGRRPQRRVDDRRRDGDPVARVRDAALFAGKQKLKEVFVRGCEKSQAGRCLAEHAI